MCMCLRVAEMYANSDSIGGSINRKGHVNTNAIKEKRLHCVHSYAWEWWSVIISPWLLSMLVWACASHVCDI